MKNRTINIFEYCKFPTVENGEPECIGLKIEKKENNHARFQFIFPVNYYTQQELKDRKQDNTQEQLRNDIKKLLEAIYKTNISEVYQNNNANDNTCPIDAYFWMIRNYLENGYYVENEMIDCKNGEGKINWKKTIQNNKFMIDNHYNIIYTQVMTKKTVHNTSNRITLIHQYCVYKTVEIFGFLFSIHLNDVQFPQINMEIETMIAILRNEYINSFLDAKKELLLNMIKMLEWLSDEKTGYDMFSIVDSKFQLVFENLINERFGNVDDLKEYYPFAKWKIEGIKRKEEGIVSSYLREDAILDNRKESNEIFILDAKYYKYAYYNEKEKVNRLPATSSIAKQIIYGEYVAAKFNRKYKVYNIFLIPFNQQKEEDYIQYIGYADAQWRNKQEDYEKIYTFKIDLKTLVNHTFGSKEENQKELKQKIREILKNNETYIL